MGICPEFGNNKSKVNQIYRNGTWLEAFKTLVMTYLLFVKYEKSDFMKTYVVNYQFYLIFWFLKKCK
jgi:hypothetical protein